MDIGHRLRDVYDEDSNLTLWDLIDMVEHAHPSSAVYRATLGDDAEWDLKTQLLALQVDATNIQIWQAGGGKGKKPKPIPRPGVEQSETKRYTVAAKSTMSEIDEWLAGRQANVSGTG